MHAVVLALDGVLLFDLSTPVEVFGRTRLPDGHAAYRMRVCAPAEKVAAGVLAIRALWGLDARSEVNRYAHCMIHRAERAVTARRRCSVTVGFSSRSIRRASICIRGSEKTPDTT